MEARSDQVNSPHPLKAIARSPIRTPSQHKHLYAFINRLSESRGMRPAKMITCKNVQLVQFGLNHTLSNFTHLIKYSFENGYGLEIPLFKLAKYHNAGRECVTNLSDMLDFDTITINSNAYRLGLFEHPAVELIEIDVDGFSLWRKHPRLVCRGNYNVNFSIQNRFQRIADEVSGYLGAYCCVHVRRGDMLKIHPRLRHDTLVSEILCKLAKQDNRVIYIMTDERDRSFFLDLKKKYKVFQWWDLPRLRQLMEANNYHLFVAEKLIMDRAKYRISTMKVLGDYFHDCLSSIDGWH